MRKEMQMHAHGDHLRLFILLGGLTFCHAIHACIWDADTLFQEKIKSPMMAEVILGDLPKPPDPKPLLERIQKLKASPKEDDPAWWNDLAGHRKRRMCWNRW